MYTVATTTPCSLPLLLYVTRVHYCIHNTPRLNHNISKLKSTRNFKLHPWLSITILSRIFLTRCIFRAVPPTEILNAFLSSAIRVTCVVSVKLQCYNESNITLKFYATSRQCHVSMSNASHGLDYNLTFCCLKSTPSNLAADNIFCMRLHHRRKSNSLWTGVASALISDIQGRVCIRSVEAYNTVGGRSNVRQSANIMGQCRHNSDLHKMLYVISDKLTLLELWEIPYTHIWP